ncbi:STAS domain-containing protein [Pseudoalteromonas sp. SMS1]|uniref:STAS domain-containing protein n=1 Tax=Pseudoalteromonas sp. SMS1 TaxID=2908894 RepID=UPI001F2C565F|nr:STAS domain-containing protein [Pseudoalteromonas sp. SMS1]MCF2858154.1 STAS domain-containing protein [Pseudoalteromonas sp. SMS1]
MSECFKFPSELTIYEVQETFNEVKSYISDKEEVSFDFSETTEVDSAGLQLIIWVVYHSQKVGLNVVTISTNELIEARFEKLGVGISAPQIE